MRLARPHRAWAVCLGGGLALFSTMGLGVNVFTVYQPLLLEANRFTNAQGSWITTTRSLFTLLALLTVNQLCAKLGPRPVMALGTGLVGVSCLCFAGAGTFPACCFAAALTGVGYCYGGMVPLALVIGRWFRDRRGFALGLSSAGSGISTVFAPPLVAWVTRRWGMGRSFLLEGLFLLLMAALVWLLVRDDPAALGLEPYRRSGTPEAAPVRSQAPGGAGLRSGWALMLAALLLGGPGGPGFSHLTVLYTSTGRSPETTAALVSWLGAVICAGKIVCGQVYDRLGGRRGNRYVLGMFSLSFLLCCLAPVQFPPLPWLTVTTFGLGLAVTSLSFPQWAADLYGGDSGMVRSLNVIFTGGMLLFGPIPGALADRTGSYVPAYALFLLFLLAALALVQGTYRRQRVSGPSPTE